MNYVIGIDPGTRGGISILPIETVSKRLTVANMPTGEVEILNFLNSNIDEFSQYVCFIEKVHSMPGQGVASSFKFGKAYGALRMAILSKGIQLTDVRPQEWQSKLGIPKRKKEETKPNFKKRLKSFALTKFPTCDNITLENADSTLIAEYGRIYSIHNTAYGLGW